MRHTYFASQISHEGSKLMVGALSIIWEASGARKHRAFVPKEREKSIIKVPKKEAFFCGLSLD